MDIPKKAYYRVSELAKMADVGVSTIHFWIIGGKIKTSGRFGLSKNSAFKISANEVERVLALLNSDS